MYTYDKALQSTWTYAFFNWIVILLTSPKKNKIRTDLHFVTIAYYYDKLLQFDFRRAVQLFYSYHFSQFTRF
jgi:hypothetical protein